MDARTRQIVRFRAEERCEYCGLAQHHAELAHHIEHIVAKQHGGTDGSDNLALACQRCNLCKGPNLTGIDPLTGHVTRLFHPRQHSWAKHFRWHGFFIEGTTAMGRATVHLLQMNDVRRLRLRAWTQSQHKSP